MTVTLFNYLKTVTMNRFFREIDLLIYDTTQIVLTEAEREEKEKRPTKKPVNSTKLLPAPT